MLPLSKEFILMLANFKTLTIVHSLAETFSNSQCVVLFKYFDLQPLKIAYVISYLARQFEAKLYVY